jgi:hypothetical protein
MPLSTAAIEGRGGCGSGGCRGKERTRRWPAIEGRGGRSGDRHREEWRSWQWRTLRKEG